MTVRPSAGARPGTPASKRAPTARAPSSSVSRVIVTTSRSTVIRSLARTILRTLATEPGSVRLWMVRSLSPRFSRTL